MFPAYSQTLRDLDLSEEDSRVLNKIIPDISLDLWAAGGAFECANRIGRRPGAAGRG